MKTYKILGKEYYGFDEDIVFAIATSKDEILPVSDIMVDFAENNTSDKHGCGEIVSIADALIDKKTYLGLNEIRKLSTDKGVVKASTKEVTYISVDGILFAVPTIYVKKITDDFLDSNLIDIIRTDLKLRIPEYLNHPKIMGDMIEYTPQGKDISIRQQKRARAVISDILLTNKNDSQMIEMLYSIICDTSAVKVEVLSGEEILEVFDRDNIVNSGNLGRSCMMDKDQSLFEIYTDNAKCVVIKDSEGKIIARAMMWDEVYCSDTDAKLDIKLVDRIYTSDDKYLTILKLWARRNWYHTLCNQTYSQTSYIDTTGKEKRMRLYVKLIKQFIEYRACPYIDTFCVGIGNRLYNDEFFSCHTTSGKAYKTYLSE